MTPTALAPAFAYHGGKARLAGRLVALMPPHKVYVEPFAGSLAVLLSKPRTNIEMVSDTNGELINFWRMLRERTDELVEACALTLYARSEYDLAFDAEPADDPIEQARRFWVKVQQGVAHKVGSKGGWQCSASDGRSSTSKASTVMRKVRGLPEVAARLAQVMVDYRPAADVIPMMDSPAALHYCDPPYVSATHDSTGAYPTTMTDVDHRELAEILHACEGAVMLSGYPSDLYDELYGDWWRIDLPGRADTANRAGATTRRVECVWSNRDLERTPKLFETIA